ncbi:MAG: 2-phosphosulfolactate phosphatase [Isosphaeraceae bacterium]
MSERGDVPWSGSVDGPARPEVFVHLLPSLIAPGSLAGSTVLVLDVLRATTVMVQALAAGCEAIIPCATVDEAGRLASSLPLGTALLAGERQGLPIPGFDLGNSPGDFTSPVCRGKTIVMTTTNGTRAILASRDAASVGIAALTNADAAVAWAAAQGRPTHVVAAGTDGQISLEDSLLAGIIAHALMAGNGYRPGNDEAVIAAALASDATAASTRRSWVELLAVGRGGRRVREIGLEADIAFAARPSTVDLVPVLQIDADGPRIVRPRVGAAALASARPERRPALS